MPKTLLLPGNVKNPSPAVCSREQEFLRISHGGEPAGKIEFLSEDEQSTAAEETRAQTAVGEGSGSTAAQPLLPGCASADSEFGIAAMAFIKN